METKFNFNSQVCTDKNQSERLLALGLKKETADMCWTKIAAIRGTFYVPELAPINMVSWRHTPAWSLHRLIEMIPDYIQETYFGVSAMDVSYYFSLCEGSIGYKFVREGGNLYDRCISCIEWLIKEGCFNKEYLEE
jgi:hypothetical protein